MTDLEIIIDELERVFKENGLELPEMSINKFIRDGEEGYMGYVGVSDIGYIGVGGGLEDLIISKRWSDGSELRSANCQDHADFLKGEKVAKLSEYKVKTRIVWEKRRRSFKNTRPKQG